MIFTEIADSVKVSDTKKAILIFGLIVASLTAIHYYHQIKLAKLRIEELEANNDNEK